MSLRARLLIVIIALLVTFGITAMLIVQNQRSLLIEQVDRRLVSTPPFRMNSVPSGTLGTPSIGPSDSFSDTYIGLVRSDGTVIPQVVGALLSSTPSFPIGSSPVIRFPEFRNLVDTISGQHFRAYFQPAPGNQGIMVTALPLSEVNDAIARLERTLILAGLVMLLVLAALYFWIQRLGLAPITRLAHTASAITAGDHRQRAIDIDPRTEAGKLGIAFNIMLDEHDETEARLRQFIADASHELRTPLTSIRGYLDLYGQGAFHKRTETDDMVRRLSSETRRMIDLVTDLLTLANLDEGRPLRYAHVDLGRIVHDAVQDARAVQPERSIGVDTPATGPIVCADEGLLVQLIGILITNAMRHTALEAAIFLRVAPEADGAVIVISDTGAGFDLETAQHAFDRFWRGESSRKRGTGGGSGLGLSIAKSIVDVHGGSISLDSTPGQGTTFTIQLDPRLELCPEETSIRDTLYR